MVVWSICVPQPSTGTSRPTSEVFSFHIPLRCHLCYTLFSPAVCSYQKDCFGMFSVSISCKLSMKFQPHVFNYVYILDFYSKYIYKTVTHFNIISLYSWFRVSVVSIDMTSGASYLMTWGSNFLTRLTSREGWRSLSVVTTACGVSLPLVGWPTVVKEGTPSQSDSLYLLPGMTTGWTETLIKSPATSVSLPYYISCYLSSQIIRLLELFSKCIYCSKVYFLLYTVLNF